MRALVYEAAWRMPLRACAVNATISGISIATVGVILMVIGVIGLVISLFFLASWRARRSAVVDERPVTRREYY